MDGEAGEAQEPVSELQEPQPLPSGAAEGGGPAVSGEALYEEKLPNQPGTSCPN